MPNIFEATNEEAVEAYRRSLEAQTRETAISYAVADIGLTPDEAELAYDEMFSN